MGRRSADHRQPPRVHVVGAAIVDDRGRCLAARRGAAMASAGAWELPGGKVEDGEAPRAALVREIREELGMEIAVGERIARGEAPAGGRTIVLDIYLARQIGGALALHEHDAVRWLAAGELDGVDWADADRLVLPTLAAHLAAVAGPQV